MITIPRWLYILVSLLPFLCKHWDVIDVGDDDNRQLVCLDCGRKLA